MSIFCGSMSFTPITRNDARQFLPIFIRGDASSHPLQWKNEAIQEVPESLFGSRQYGVLLVISLSFFLYSSEKAFFTWITKRQSPVPSSTILISENFLPILYLLGSPSSSFSHISRPFCSMTSTGRPSSLNFSHTIFAASSMTRFSGFTPKSYLSADDFFFLPLLPLRSP